MRYTKLTLGLVAGFGMTIALAAIQPTTAAPITTGAAALKSSVASDVVDVRWRSRRWGYYGGGFATGLALAALAARPYYYGYGDPYYYAPPPAYYAPPPAYYTEPYPDPNGPRRQCWVPTDPDRGFGYYRPC